MENNQSEIQGTTEAHELTDLEKKRFARLRRKRRFARLAKKGIKRKRTRRNRTARARKKKALKRRRTFKLKRVLFGYRKRRWNILLAPLKPLEQKLLLDNKLLKYLAYEDSAVLILFKIYDAQRYQKNSSRIFFNHFSNSYSTLDKIKNDSQYINWKCAVCKDNIKSNINLFNVENFICETCAKTHSKTDFIDERITHSSVKFRKTIELLYDNQRKIHKKITREN